MWEKITTLNQLQDIKINDLILRYPIDDQKVIENPTGNENNSELYIVTAVTSDRIKLNYLSQTKTIGDFSIGSMTRELDFSDINKKIWWKK